LASDRRIGAFEVLEPDHEIREMIIRNEPGLHIHQRAVEEGMRTIRDDALLKARMGITSLGEVARVSII